MTMVQLIMMMMMMMWGLQDDQRRYRKRRKGARRRRHVTRTSFFRNCDIASDLTAAVAASAAQLLAAFPFLGGAYLLMSNLRLGVVCCCCSRESPACVLLRSMSVSKPSEETVNISELSPSFSLGEIQLSRLPLSCGVRRCCCWCCC